MILILVVGVQMTWSLAYIDWHALIVECDDELTLEYITHRESIANRQPHIDYRISTIPKHQ